MAEETKKCLEQARESMNATIVFFDKELQKIRAGKASPQMLEGLKVDYYGNQTPIEQVANINTPDARQIVIQPWERPMLPIIEKAILAANPGFNPQNNGEFIRIVVPTPTEERRKELVKKIKQETEQNKVTIRNLRRTANDLAKKLKDNGIPEDEAKKLETDIQKLTDDFIAKIDKMSELKEKEIIMFPENLKYSHDHEWLKMDGEIAIIGITEYAAEQLGDIVFVDVNTVGDTIDQNDVFGSIEAVKTVSDLLLPISGEIVEFNEELEANPALINSDPYNAGWIIKIKPTDVSEMDALLTAEQYTEEIA